MAAASGSIWRKQVVFGRQFIGLLQERGCLYLNCYTNLEKNRGPYKLTLIDFYYVNRGMSMDK